MLPKHPKVEIVRRVQNRAQEAAPKSGSGHRGDRSLYGHLNSLRHRLGGDEPALDYNHLSFEEKQAALALVDAGEARFSDSRDGRTLIERHSPSLIKRFLSMGTYA